MFDKNIVKGLINVINLRKLVIFLKVASVFAINSAI